MKQNHTDVSDAARSRSHDLIARAAIASLLLLCIAVAFARFTPSPPVIDAATGRMPRPAEIAISENVVVFVLDSPLDPAYVRARHGIAHEPASHGSMVARVLRNHANVTIVGLPAEDITGKRHREDFLDALRACLGFARANPQARVVLNISLAFDEPDPEKKTLIEQLHGAGVMIVAAAGNDASEKAVYPAAYEHVIAVASAGKAGKAPHSNYGGHIDISASGDASLEELAFLPRGTRRRITETRGTSYAAPRVSAALAYIRQKRPDWSGAQSLEFLRESAIPIENSLFEKGYLGTGYVDIANTKAMIHRPFFWIHRFLPYMTFSLLTSISAAVIVMKKLPGMMIALLLWLGAVPVIFLLFLGMGRTLSAVKTGWHAGEGPYMIAALLSTGACILYLRCRPFETLRALLLPAAAGLVLGPAGTAPAVKGLVLSALPPATTALWEWRERRILRRLEGTFHAAADHRERCRVLAGAREKHLAPRVRRKIVDLLLRGPLLLSICYLHQLIDEERHAEGAKQLLNVLPELEETSGRSGRQP